MLVSWKWLRELVDLPVDADEFARRMMLAGFNHEGTAAQGGDLAIDLEITSNRPDCLGHLGIAREAAVLLDVPLRLTDPQPPATGPPIEQAVRLAVHCPRLCPKYTARLIRGVRVGPSPAWLRDRLATLGLASVNNVVDVTNYVLMLYGHPLHAFDFARLSGGAIEVREARPDESIQAIDHREYRLPKGACVIADAKSAVAVAGVMGGAQSEVTAATRDLLIEAAVFDPQSVRGTARALNLHSPSSYRFERGVDFEGVDRASRHCAELILELAGGQLAAGVLCVAQPPPPASLITLRFSQIPRVLGIEVPPQRVRHIISALGCHEAPAASPTAAQAAASAGSASLTVQPPSWRQDLSREIDLIEEVARIHGYDAIPEDVRVPMATSRRGDLDLLLEKVRRLVTAAGFDEAMTSSVVEPSVSDAFSPWTERPALRTSLPVLRGADQLRRSLIPSLLVARRTNDGLGNVSASLFEIAKVYLPRPGQLPEEPWMLGLVASGDFLMLKGLLESLAELLAPGSQLVASPSHLAFFQAGRGALLQLGSQSVAICGQLSQAALKSFELRAAATPLVVAELRLDPWLSDSGRIPQYRKQPTFPATTRDVNLEVNEEVTWARIETVVRSVADASLESLRYVETYRDDRLRAAGRKSVLMNLTFRGQESTLTSQQVDDLRKAITEACRRELAAELRA